MKMKIRIGLAGVGDIAKIRYLYAIDKLPDQYELVALFTYNEKKCQALESQYQIPVYSNYQDFLNNDAVDAVIICTRHTNHAKMAILAMEKGKGVLVEKPAAVSATDVRRIRTTALNTGKHCMLLPTMGYPCFLKAKEMIRSGVIGRICSVDGVFANSGPGHAAWFLDQEQAAWGVMADLGIYPIAALSYLLGQIESVSASCQTVFPQRKLNSGEVVTASVDDNVAAVLTWENGVVGTIRASWCVGSNKSNSLYNLTIYGSEGILFINLLSHQLIIFKPDWGDKPFHYQGLYPCYEVLLPEFDDHLTIMEQYYQWYISCDHTEERYQLDMQVDVIAVIEDMYEASAIGTTIKKSIKR